MAVNAFLATAWLVGFFVPCSPLPLPVEGGSRHCQAAWASLLTWKCAPQAQSRRKALASLIGCAVAHPGAEPPDPEQRACPCARSSAWAPGLGAKRSQGPQMVQVRQGGKNSPRTCVLTFSVEPSCHERLGVDWLLHVDSDELPRPCLLFMYLNMIPWVRFAFGHGLDELSLSMQGNKHQRKGPLQDLAVPLSARDLFSHCPFLDRE